MKLVYFKKKTNKQTSKAQFVFVLKTRRNKRERGEKKKKTLKWLEFSLQLETLAPMARSSLNLQFISMRSISDLTTTFPRPPKIASGPDGDRRANVESTLIDSSDRRESAEFKWDLLI